jgi:hypothetical protein
VVVEALRPCCAHACTLFSHAGIDTRRRLLLPGVAASKAQLEARPKGLNIALEALHACSGHPLHRNVEHLEALFIERKSTTQRRFGCNKKWSSFSASDGLGMVLHCNHKTKVSKDNDSCLEGLIPATAMQMSDGEVKDIY